MAKKSEKQQAETLLEKAGQLLPDAEAKRRFKALSTEALRNGSVPMRDVLDFADEVESLEAEQLEKLCELLTAAGVTVTDEADELLEEDEAASEDASEEKESETADEEDFVGVDSVKQYLKEIGRVPLLSPERELELAKRVKDGDESARAEMINANLRLVVNIAKRYRDCGMEYRDLIQEGNIGLMKAVDKFDYERGNRFSTCGHLWIRQAIRRALADHGRTVRLPAHIVEDLQKMKRFTAHYTQENSVDPTVEEIARGMNITEEKVRQLKRVGQQPVYLDTPIGEEDDTCVGDTIKDENAVQPDEAIIGNNLREAIDTALEGLDAREAKVLRLRYGLGDNVRHTLEEVGEIMGITRERVRQIEQNGLRRLRGPRNRRLLEDFLQD